MLKQFLIFTDMDGTLLDHNTYSYEAAAATLAKLAAAKIPVIPTTSKTYSELLVLREDIGLSSPFIVENGAAIHIPHGFFKQKPSNTQWQNQFWVRQFTSRKHYWLNLLEQVGQEYQGLFNHFSNMTIEEIAESTGLTVDAATRASERQYGEPVLWQGSETEKARFVTELRLKGARPLQGGRFVHISGECDKGAALQWMKSEFHRQYPDRECVCIALGDGENDVAMLEAADIAVLIRSPSHKFPKILKETNVYTSRKEGPAGWSECLEVILSDYL